MDLSHQIAYLLLMALPVACVAWTVTHEEIFREPRDYCVEKSKSSRTLFQRKLFYLFTCEYCFSHYVTLFLLLATHFKVLFDGWQGYIISFFSIVWIANVYMGLFGFLRQSLKVEKIEAKLKDTEWQEVKEEKNI